MSNPAVAEKGKLNAKIELSAPGGHSSVPPRHTVGTHALVVQTWIFIVSTADHRHARPHDHRARSQPSHATPQP